MAQVVISYSRVDRELVDALLTLLRALPEMKRAIYWDKDFEPGEDWFEQIRRAIDVAPLVFVFWCCHSSDSRQVQREVDYAFSKGRKVVPVLLDDTPLSPQLAAIHGIDLRFAVHHSRALSALGADSVNQLRAEFSGELRKVDRRWSRWTAVGLLAAGVGTVGVGLWLNSQRAFIAPPMFAFTWEPEPQDPPGGEETKILVGLKNKGHGPAFDVRVRYHITLATSAPPEPEWALLLPSEPITVLPRADEEPYVNQEIGFRFWGLGIHEYRSKKKRIYGWFEITYSDITGSQRTRACVMREFGLPLDEWYACDGHIVSQIDP